MPLIELGGRTLHYQDVGAGLPVLLLHGFPFSSESFWPQLAAPPNGVRYLAPDHRGFGRSALGPGVASMEALAEDALGLLDALKLESVVVGGVSMGGYVAIALTRRDPGRVKGLILMDTQSLADDAAGRERREAVAREAEAKGMGPLVEAMLPKLFSPKAPAEPKARIERLMRAQNPLAAAAASRGMAGRTDGKDILSRFAGPCLVVVGQEDVITPVERAQAMVGLVSGARLLVVPEAGHLANVEKPDVVNEAITSFVTTV